MSDDRDVAKMEVSLENTPKIPAIWFDFYGRLIPGCAIVSVNIGLFGIGFSVLSFTQLIALGIFGFLIGHINQPIASHFARIYEDNLFTGKQDFQVESYKLLAKMPREQELLSKHYSEAVGFFSIATLFIFQIAWQQFIASNRDFLFHPFDETAFSFRWYAFPFLSLLMIALGMERIRALVRRKERLVTRMKLNN